MFYVYTNIFLPIYTNIFLVLFLLIDAFNYLCLLLEESMLDM